MTGLRRRPIPQSTLLAQHQPDLRHRRPRRTGRGTTAAILASSLTETELPLAGRGQNDDKQNTGSIAIDACACWARSPAFPSRSVPARYTGGEVVTASIPDDYRLRHPIAVQEADRSIVIFVGHARGGLSAPQRADVMGLAQTWVREGTGAIVADVPVDTPNARAAAECVPGNPGRCLRRAACRRAASRCVTTIRTIRERWRRSG